MKARVNYWLKYAASEGFHQHLPHPLLKKHFYGPQQYLIEMKSALGYWLCEVGWPVPFLITFIAQVSDTFKQNIMAMKIQ